MNDIQDYPSSLSDPANRTYATFSYLPEMSAEEIRQQVEYIVAKSWNPAIEHTEPENAFDHYWYMWKLPMFGETDKDRILGEAKACHEAHPDHHVRLVGYDNDAQSQGAAMVIYRGKAV